MERLTFDGNFCDIAMCRENRCPYDGSCTQRKVWERLKEYEDAEQDGRLVVLPFPLHSTLFDASNEARPKLLKDFRLSAAWTHCGIVFHYPWSIFLNNIERGYIKQMSEEAEAALKGEDYETYPV